MSKNVLSYASVIIFYLFTHKSYHICIITLLHLPFYNKPLKVTKPHDVQGIVAIGIVHRGRAGCAHVSTKFKSVK